MSLREDAIGAEISTVYTKLTHLTSHQFQKQKVLRLQQVSGVYTLAVGFFRFNCFLPMVSAEVIATYAKSGRRIYCYFSLMFSAVGTSGYMEIRFDEAVEAGTSDASVQIKYRFYRC